MSIRRS
ncbi:hypothetical protein SPV_2514 [Streptococcus pneumoniae]|nr:hypothetical protein SPV_2514 [Streptococcus pneumoniae]